MSGERTGGGAAAEAAAQAAAAATGLPGAEGCRPLVSVLMPTFRRPQLLPKALASILAQTGIAAGTLEVLVIDNCPEASAREAVATLAAAGGGAVVIRYLHEPRPGISYPRNTGVAEARGRFILFLDDDQEAAPGLIAAYLAAWRQTGAAALFGPVEAVLEPAIAPGETAPHRDRDAAIRAYFSRRYAVADGADITADIARLGTNNAFFERAICFPEPAPFHPALGTIGGEDTLIFRTLKDRGIRFVWVAAALAHEFVPRQRQSFRYVRMRRFRSGQIRVLTCLRLRPRRPGQAVLWMTIGLMQMMGYGLAAAISWLGHGGGWQELASRAWGGAGKVLWMEKFRFPAYGAASRLSR